VSLTVPFFGGISGTWRPDDAERKAAAELYFELVTRIAVVGLEPGQGILREALSSYYSIFSTTREILRRYGREVAPRDRQDEITFGSLAVAVLNGVLRPLLVKWHAELSVYEAARPADVSVRGHERAWDKEPELRAALGETSTALEELARILAEVAGVADLLSPPPTPGLGNHRGGVSGLPPDGD
jgi:hypothetical protein